MTRIVTIVTLLAALAFAGAANAATVVSSESDAKGGDFSNSHKVPTVFAKDVFLVAGAQNNKPDVDWLMFDGFEVGTERLELTFTNPGGTWGGVNVRLKDAAFKNINDWWPLMAQWSISGVTDDRSVTVSYVLDGYTGPIYAALEFYKDNDFRNGNGLAYSIAKIGGQQLPELAPMPMPAAVPVPGAGLFTLAGVGALTLLRRGHRSA